MAIKVNGTTVIDNSRNLSNVGGLKTVGGSSILGSGDISVGGSTTLGAVGTYAMLRPNSSFPTYKAPGSTISGSDYCYSDGEGGNPGVFASGTWRMMGYIGNYTTNATVMVRIS